MSVVIASVWEVLISVRDHFRGDLFFALGVLLFGGFFAGRLAQKVKLPAVTGYVVAGLFLGPSVLGLIPEHVSEGITEVIPATALGLIALRIGGEFTVRVLKRVGWELLVIALVQVLVTFAVVAGSLAFFCELYVALLLGAIASATAPAATVAVIRECRASGPLTRTIIGVVALDDALCIMLFGIVFAVSGVLVPEMAGLSISGAVVKAFLEIVGAIVLGLAMGTGVHFLIRKREDRNEILVIVLAAVFANAGIAVKLALSPLIANMLMGFLLVNVSERNRRVFNILAPIEVPIFAGFFTIAGTELNIAALIGVGMIGLLYIGARVSGKMLGAALGSLVTRTKGAVKKYLGLGLLPQAGVAIGLLYMVATSGAFPEGSNGAAGVELMINVVLASVLVSELVGPPLTKFAIERAGEIGREEHVPVRPPLRTRTRDKQPEP